MKHFSEKEFACKCGACDKGFKDMRGSLIDHLQVARELADTPFKITSAIRCERHNTLVGGVSTSAHMTGHAVDISCTSSTQRFKLIAGLLGAGFHRILVYPNFIHVDTDSSKEAQHIISLM
jgi:uncharacterized protein YcbK (DUF882 family)